MKNLHFLLLGILALFCFSSCDNMTEEISFSKDGTGTYKAYTNAIPSIRMMITEMSYAMAIADSLGIDSVSLNTQIEEEIWKDFPGDLDSLFSITENMPDSLLAELEKYPHLKKVEGFMEGGKNKGYLNTGVKFPFKNLAEFKMIMTDLEKQQKMSGEQAVFDEFSMAENFDYSFENGLFSRVYHPPPQGETLPEEELMDFRTFFGEASFVTRIKFDQKILKVKGDHILDQSEKEVSFKYDLLKMMNGEQDLSFEIYLK